MGVVAVRNLVINVRIHWNVDFLTQYAIRRNDHVNASKSSQLPITLISVEKVKPFKNDFSPICQLLKTRLHLVKDFNLLLWYQNDSDNV